MTKRLALFFAINTVVLNLLLIYVFSTSWRETVFFETFIFVHRAANVFLHRPVQNAADSWYPMIRAFEYARSSHEVPLYTKILFEEKIKFQYPPTSLLALYLIPYGWLDWISWFFVLATAVIIAFAYPLSGFAAPLPAIVRSALLICFALTFYPLMKGLSLGQIQTWITFLAVLLFLFWTNKKEGVAGVLVGVMSLLKPQYLILLLWGLLRKKHRFAASGAAVVFAGIVLSVALFGIADHLNYFSALSFLSKHGEAYHANQSINGLLNRLFLNGEIALFQKDQFPPYNGWVYAGTIATSLALIATALFSSPGSNVLNFSIMALTCTIASPIAWEHHYAILLPIYALLLPQIREKRSLILLAVSYVLTSNYFAFTKKLADTPFGMNLLESYLLAGALIVLALLYRAARQKTSSTTPPKK